MNIGRITKKEKPVFGWDTNQGIRILRFDDFLSIVNYTHSEKRQNQAG